MTLTNNSKESLELILNNSFKESVPLAFLKLLNHSVHLYINESLTYINDINENLYEMSNYAINLFLNLEDVLKENGEEKFKKIETIINYKEKLEKLYRILYAYYTELNIATLILNDKNNLLSSKDNNIESLDFNLFYEDCFVFINEFISPDDLESVLCQLLSSIPIRVSKNKYYEYVEKSLLLINEPEERLKDIFEFLKEQFNGKHVKGYHDFLPDIAMSIENCIEKALEKPNKDEIEGILKEIESIEDNLLNLGDLLLSLYDIFNCMSVLLMLQNVDLESLYNRHVAYKDFYLSSSSLFNEDTDPHEKEILIETLPDLMNQHIGILENNLLKINRKIKDILSNESLKIDSHEELSNIFENHLLIFSHLNQRLMDTLVYNTKNQKDLSVNKELEKYIQKFIQYLDSEFKNMTNPLRKARMQNFLGLIPLAMNSDEFMDYLINAVNMSSDKNKARIVDNIGRIMAYYGFFDNHHCDCNHDHDENCHCHHSHDHKNH